MATLGNQPRGLSTLFFTELWERFSYYGMRALLVIFMTAPVAAGGLGYAAADAARIYGNYTMAVYLLSIPGGFIADRLLGAGRAVLIGGSIIAAGHFTLAIPDARAFVMGLVLIALGTGLFKPNISVLVGNLYAAHDERRDAGFTIFYMGVNLGALAAPLVTGFLAESAAFRATLAAWGFDPNLGWHFGFAAAGVGMTLGLMVYIRRLGRLRDPERKTAAGDTEPWRGAALVGLGTLALFGLVLLSDRDGFAWLRGLFLLAPTAAIAWFASRKTRDGYRLAAVLVLFVAAMIFWAIFEQAGVTMALFAKDLTRTELLGIAFPSSYFQSLNPLFVIVLAPVFASLWVWLGPHQPSSPVKFAIGLFLLAGSFLLMVPAAELTAEGKVSPLWLAGLFLLQTLGELCLSPVGLSAMTKLAPAGLAGLILGLWFLAAALGNKLAGVLGMTFTATDPTALAHTFFLEGAAVFLAALVMLALAPWTRRLMAGAE